MKAKKTPPRRRISFAVDRDEIEINSDWVNAVMGPPTAASPQNPFPATPTEVPFFAPDENNATGAENAPVERCAAVEETAPVDQAAPVAHGTPVEEIAVASFTTVAPCSTDELPDRMRAGERLPDATVELFATDQQTARIPRPRPILRITDGLTPGQYAVYSLMYGAAAASGDGNSRIYKGGYADLGRLTGLSKRGLQNIIAELQSKQVIRLHQQPGYHRTETSAYLVPPPEAVLAAWFAMGWRHALGKGKVLAG